VIDGRAAARCTAVVLLVAAALVLSATPAAACTCARMTDDELFDVVDAVFVGTSVEVRDQGGTPSTRRERIVLAVERVYKGDVHARQTVVTWSSASCGLAGQLPVGTRALVFAEAPFPGLVPTVEGELAVSGCGTTRPIAGGSAPASFGAGYGAVPGASPIGPPGSSRRPWVVAAVAGAALGVVVAAGSRARAARLRRRRPTT
jgi:hypothetical protein